jgi:hypothetical protein
MPVIESDDYRQEQETLMADPIVLAMLDELPPESIPMEGGHSFMLAALHEYNARGGTNARSIGSVARALIALNRERT